jgi:hypothetical protein
MGRRRRRLPEGEGETLSALSGGERSARAAALWRAGWSLTEIGSAMDPPRGKTTVRRWVGHPDADALPVTDVPEPPPRPVGSRRGERVRRVSPGVPPDMIPRLRDLSSLARRYRARTDPAGPTARANEELTAVARTLRSVGVPTAEIARAAGVSYRAMARRVGR